MDREGEVHLKLCGKFFPKKKKKKKEEERNIRCPLENVETVLLSEKDKSFP